jgi:DNA topoisomerase-2
MDITSFMSDDTASEPNKVGLYSITDVATKEWKNWALYTVESRSIPNVIDGMKPVQRFYLYSSIVNSKKEFKKVSAISGIISEYGYNHGESSAATSGQLMAATWSNNLCLIEGRGSFGTRLIQEPGAPRYVYTRLHENFNKYITDLDLSPVHEDPEHEPPAYYLPTIPLVLSNGTKGVATGFATDILPRCTDSLISACNEYISTGKIKDMITVKYPEFKGTVEYDKIDNRYYILGCYERKGGTGLSITEVPYGFDRIGYIKVLDKLEDDGDIVSYADMCDSNGFRFDVKLKQQISAKWSDEVLVKKFKLEKPVTENLTVIGFDGLLRKYDDARELVADFCDFRMGVLQRRIDNKIETLGEDVRWFDVKRQFIEAVLDDKIVFKNKKKVQVSKQIIDYTDAVPDDTDRLLRINIMSLTSDMVAEMKKQQTASKKELKFWKTTTTKAQFKSDLDKLL